LPEKGNNFIALKFTIMKNDSQIQKDVMDELKWQPILNAAEIGVSVKKGIVTLSGIVNNNIKKVSAENAARNVAGVKAIAEDIQIGVSPFFSRTDTEIAEAVVDALKASVSVPGEKIKTRVEDGIVTLDGEVDWDYQRKAAGRVTEVLSGVRKVYNYINLKPVVTPANIKQKITAAFHRSATLDAEKITVDVISGKVILTGKVRSFAEREDAENAAWAAPGVLSVENKLELMDAGVAF
jgi:osmotically-inducible protein OsmY